MFSRIKRAIIEYRELRYLAYHDPLTGLLNRTWLYKNIDQINTIYVYFIDINGLHEINKKGHTFGDDHIKKAIATIRHHGILLRYAGDEFLLFSNYKNEVSTNDLFCVGRSMICQDIETAINTADAEMIKAKIDRH